MVVRGSALVIDGQDFKAITCGYTESSEGVCLNCDILLSSLDCHHFDIRFHHKPSDSISVIYPVQCRVTPGESDGGGITGRHTKVLRWSTGN